MNRKTALTLTLTATAFLTGCSSYVNTPNVKAARAQKQEAFSHTLISRAYNAQPTITFPATIAIAPQGTEALMQLRALDALGKLDSLKRLPDLRGLPLVSGLVESDIDHPDAAKVADLRLREAAARLHADAVLIMSIETNATDGQIFSPLTVATLGLFPNNRYEIIATGLLALVDTRTGYVYGTLEKSAAKSGIVMVAGSDESLERRKHQAQREAMEKLLSEVPAFWQSVVSTHRK